MLKVEVDLFALADELVAKKWLAEWDADNRAEIERALSLAVGHMILRRDA